MGEVLVKLLTAYMLWVLRNLQFGKDFEKLQFIKHNLANWFLPVDYNLIGAFCCIMISCISLEIYCIILLYCIMLSLSHIEFECEFQYDN